MKSQSRRKSKTATGRAPRGAGRGKQSDLNRKPDEMEGFRPGPGNTGSMTGKDETGQKQINHTV